MPQLKHPTIFYTLAPRVLRRLSPLIYLYALTRFNMLAIGRVADSRAVYFFEEIILGADDSYYTQAGEAPGQWIGTGSRNLGLNGAVSQEQIAAVLAGLTPDGLLKLRATKVSRPGYDLTFSAPKSVSIAWGLGDQEQVTRIAAAHHAAVVEAVRYLEENATFVRRGHAGAQVVEADGFVAAAFQHRTNRSLDPQLHTHVVVANMAQGPDTRWTALDGRRIYEHSRTSGAIYQARLRHELATAPGFLFEPNDNGTFELIGVNEEQRQLFSKRRRQIETQLSELSMVSAKSAQVATLTTRPDKTAATSDQQLRDQWETEGQQVDLDVSNLTTLPRTPSVTIDNEELADTLTQSDATFKRQHVLRAAAEASTEGATLDQLEVVADHYLASEHAIDLGAGWWTTPAELQLEQQAVALASRPTHVLTANARDIERAIATRPTLTDEQQQMVAGLTQSGQPVELVVGWAGTGKTFSLDAVREAYEASGFTLTGASLSARAAAELEGGSGITSATADRLLMDLASGRQVLRETSVLVIDEAGMLGNRRLAALVNEAAQANAKLILVGDPKQLPEIDPGGLFKGLVERIGYHELVDNLRQQDPVERQIVKDIRLGNAPAAVEQLVNHGRIITAPNADELRNTMVADWHRSSQQGNSVLMTASRRSAVADLNHRARHVLAAEGQLGPTVLTHENVDFAIGDKVMTLRNNRKLGLTNGELGTIQDGASNGLTILLANGTSKQVPADYITSGHLAHGYASTIHKAQGATCDEAFVLADDSLSQETGYTALTRGKEANRVYLVQPESSEHQVGIDNPLSLLTHSLGHSNAKTAAIDRLGASPSIGI